MAVRVMLDQMLVQRRMSLGELSDRVGLTVANLTILKSGRARAIRLTTLDGLCRELGCRPGELLAYLPGAQEDLEPEPEGESVAE